MQPQLGIWKRFIRSLLGVDRCSLSWGSGRGLLEVYQGWTDAASSQVPWMSTGLSSWSRLWHSILNYISWFRILLYKVSDLHQGKAQRIASQVQHSAFLASQLYALDELVDMACLLVDTIKEMSGAPVHLSPLSSTDRTYFFHGRAS